MRTTVGRSERDRGEVGRLSRPTVTMSILAIIGAFLAAVAAILVSSSTARAAAPSTITVAWLTTSDPTGPLPTDADSTTWPQTYVGTVPACGTPAIYQVDVYRYATDQDKAIVDALIRHGSLNKPGAPDWTDSSVVISWSFVKVSNPCSTATATPTSPSSSPTPSSSSTPAQTSATSPSSPPTTPTSSTSTSTAVTTSPSTSPPTITETVICGHVEFTITNPGPAFGVLVEDVPADTVPFSPATPYTVAASGVTTIEFDLISPKYVLDLPDTVTLRAAALPQEVLDVVQVPRDCTLHESGGASSTADTPAPTPAQSTTVGAPASSLPTPTGSASTALVTTSLANTGAGGGELARITLYGGVVILAGVTCLMLGWIRRTTGERS